MKKKIFALLTALCMTAAVLPAVFADGEEDPEPTCTCTTQCTEESKNETCPVCGVEDADLSQCIGTPPMTVGTQEHCSCVVLCTEDNKNPNCPVCSAEGADLAACKGEPAQPVLFGAPKAGDVTYIDADGQTQTVAEGNYITVYTDTTSWSTGWYVAQGEITIGSENSPRRVTVKGNVNLILEDGCNLTVNGGIEVADTNSLTIYAQSTGSSMGTLNATGVADCAGIGGGNGHSGGKITISGGVVKATGGYEGAGIGGSYKGSGGEITINGGEVTANGGYSGAGIGGGNNGSGGSFSTDREEIG